MRAETTHIWYQLSSAQTAEQLGVELEHGLSPVQVQDRQARYGKNALPEAPRPSLWALLGRQAKNFIVLVLLGAVVLSLVLGERGDAAAIVVALILNVAVGLLMDFRAERDLASLRSLSSPRARVRRAGHQVELPASELVPGDVVLLQPGDRVPADARLVAGACAVDESLLTGESLPVEKSATALTAAALALAQRRNEVFAGSRVRTGSSVVVVTATGAQSELGRIGKLLCATHPPAVPLNRRLATLGRYLTWLVAAVGVLLLALGLWQGQPFWPLMRTAIVLAVAAIPEGLPSVATLALIAAARRLGRRKLRVRHLGVLEALGGITTLCLDKTGTLTDSTVTVRAVELADHELTVTGEGFTPSGEFQEGGRRLEPASQPGLLLLLRTCQFCNEAALLEKEGRWHIHGDPTEGALLCAAAKAGLPDPRQLLLEPAVRTVPVGRGHPFMIVVTRAQKEQRLYIKGAPEQVLARCSTVCTSAGRQVLDAGQRAQWLARNHRLAERALRVFGVAIGNAPIPAAGQDDKTEPEHGWEWLGLVGMTEPPRSGVKDALALAHRAGIRTIMITGDQPATAAALARELDLAAGRVPRVLFDSQAPVADVDVYARATPEGKLQLVQALQRSGQQVGLTADGVNDAPALRAADAGIALGRSTEVAKAAAALVLADERLSTLLAGVAEGRAVFRNLQKALDYLLSCSLATVLAALITMAVGNPPILLPLQILYLNLLMHTFPAFGLTRERASPDLLQRAPPRREAALLSPTRLAAILWHGTIIAIAAVAIGAWGLHHEGAAHGRSLAFATLATALLLHAFSDRSPRPFRGWAAWRNPTLLGCVAVALALQLLALYLPALRSLLMMTHFTPADWLGVLAAAAGSVLAVELSKWTWPQEGPEAEQPGMAPAPPESRSDAER